MSYTFHLRVYLYIANKNKNRKNERIKVCAARSKNMLKNCWKKSWTAGYSATWTISLAMSSGISKGERQREDLSSWRLRVVAACCRFRAPRTIHHRHQLDILVLLCSR